MSFNLEAERRNRGLTLRELADEIGIDMHALRRAEQGGKPHPKNAKLIADHFGVQVTAIWPVSDPEREAAA